MPTKSSTGSIALFNRPKIKTGAVLLLAYFVTYLLAFHFLPASTELYPATAIALCAIYFGGMRLWPALYLTALVAAVLSGTSALTLITLPVAVTLQAIAGTYLLRAGHTDPLFRRYRDMFYLIATILAISFISPTIEAFADVARAIPYSPATWAHAYLASVFCLLIITPFILRWLTKIGFRRTAAEIYETVTVFAVLTGINYEFFTLGIPTVLGIPLPYALLIPLFFIALRLRPRFVTLALLLTAAFAITSVLMNTGADTLAARLFEAETFIIVLATIFFIIVSLEEDRRVNTNLIHSQLDTLQNAVARISSESEAKNSFIAVLAHELRNPLAPIASGIETLRLKGSGNADDAATLDMMADRMNTIRQILDDLLDISRIAEGKVAFKSETVNLIEGLNRAILSTQHHRKELHQSLVYTPPQTPLYIAGDPVRIEQIFSNLLTNASKYSDPGDTITLTVRKRDRIVEIEVADEGIGLDADSTEAIFMPFHQIGHGTRSQKGLGIGLALVRNFVGMHRGSVVATSEGPGLGSRFTVSLPILLSASPEKMNKAPGLQAPGSGSGTHLHVLVVDDNDAAAAGIGRLLELKGCSISYAYTGNQAIEKALEISPDVVLLDVGLPDIDGYTVAKNLRASGFAGRLIALSGYSTEDAKRQGKEAGFDHYVVKPAGFADLKKVLPELT